MKRLFLLLCALAVAPGCVSPSGNGFFDDAAKDWRGDNMRMRSGMSQWDDELPAATMAKPTR
ncbi:MAG: hypothetical protein U0746_17410 [Gemmataceae bacterium]